eukprot:s2743_g2.t1
MNVLGASHSSSCHRKALHFFRVRYTDLHLKGCSFKLAVQHFSLVSWIVTDYFCKRLRTRCLHLPSSKRKGQEASRDRFQPFMQFAFEQLSGRWKKQNQTFCTTRPVSCPLTSKEVAP